MCTEWHNCIAIVRQRRAIVAAKKKLARELPDMVAFGCILDKRGRLVPVALAKRHITRYD